MKTLLGAAALVIAGAFGPAHAVTHVVDASTGILLGAKNVLVSGAYYDVEFVDGSCVQVYSGCDEATDFAIDTLAGATAATQALMDQVFLDVAAGSFDTRPELIRGCAFGRRCIAITKYIPGFVITSPRTVNDQNEAFDGVVVGGSDAYSQQPATSTTNSGQVTFARWSPAPLPVPASAWLMISALAAVFGARRWRARAT